MNERTFLFVPGNRPERFAKALASGADAVVLDLEDAVAVDAKPQARAAIAAWARAASVQDRERTVVRINDVTSPAFASDLAMLREADITSVMLPKAEDPQHIARVRHALASARVLPLIESARGLDRVADIARSDGVGRLVFGTLDFAVDLDLDIDVDNEPLAYAASRLALASRLAGIEPPVAGVTPKIDDEQRLLADLAWARRHGFGAKLCIHPRQIAPIHAAMQPTAEQVAWARRVVAAAAESQGAAQVDGQMVDRPVVLRAQRTLQRARD